MCRSPKRLFTMSFPVEMFWLTVRIWAIRSDNIWKVMNWCKIRSYYSRSSNSHDSVHNLTLWDGGGGGCHGYSQWWCQSAAGWSSSSEDPAETTAGISSLLHGGRTDRTVTLDQDTQCYQQHDTSYYPVPPRESWTEAAAWQCDLSHLWRSTAPSLDWL